MRNAERKTKEERQETRDDGRERRDEGRNKCKVVSLHKNSYNNAKIGIWGGYSEDDDSGESQK